jgi:hypothetical protein
MNNIKKQGSSWVWVATTCNPSKAANPMGKEYVKAANEELGTSHSSQHIGGKIRIVSSLSSWAT